MEHEELLQAIIDTVNGAGGLWRRKQIASYLGYSKCPHVIKAIEELVALEKLYRHAGTYRHRDCWYYSTKWKQGELDMSGVK